MTTPEYLDYDNICPHERKFAPYYAICDVPTKRL